MPACGVRSSDADAIASNARLSNLKHRAADLIRSPMHTVSSGKPSIVKFSPNCPWDKVVIFTAPGQWRSIDLIYEDGSLLTSVPGQSP